MCYVIRKIAEREEQFKNDRIWMLKRVNGNTLFYGKCLQVYLKKWVINKLGRVMQITSSTKASQEVQDKQNIQTLITRQLPCNDNKI